MLHATEQDCCVSAYEIIHVCGELKPLKNNQGASKGFHLLGVTIIIATVIIAKIKTITTKAITIPFQFFSSSSEPTSSCNRNTNMTKNIYNSESYEKT